jgi:ribosomal protection tetracycline resistance protein
VLAHVDAGKTSLTEALLHTGGALDQLGRVDDGTTQTDNLALERRRGITIRTAVATFAFDGVTVNLVDTPGHPDFIAEVDRSLAVLDGAVLVLSAVEGVQAQTIVLYRALRRLGVPAVFMINKIDRAGADPDRVLAAIRRRLTAAVVPLGTVGNPGTAAASYLPPEWSDPKIAEKVTAELAEHDDALLDAWVTQGRLPGADQLWAALTQLTRNGQVHPVLFGSAITGAGVADVIEVVTALFAVETADPASPAAGQLFKVERSAAGERICSIRMRAGTLAVRDHVVLGGDRVGTVTALEVHEPGGAVGRDRVTAGQIARVRGLTAARIGDYVGSHAASIPELMFPPPALETAVVAREPGQQVLLHAALNELADVDPLIQLRPDDHQGAVRITVYGEVQQQVIAETLAAEHGIEVDFRSTTVICVERPAGIGEAVRRMGDPGHLYGATLGVTVEPAAPGAGVELVVTAPRITLPLHVYSTVEGFHGALLRYLGDPLATGPYGWQVTDIRVTVTENGYTPPGPSPAHVRRTTAVVVAEAIGRAGTVVCEPVDRFRVEAPAETVSTVLGLIGRHRGSPDAPHPTQTIVVITGILPTASVDAVRRGLHSATHGEGLFESVFDHHTPRRGTAPRRGDRRP